MVRVPIAGRPDWKWLIIGILFAMFGLPMITAGLAKLRGGSADKNG